MTLLWLAVAAASAAGGSLVGPAGEAPPPTSATRISVAPGDGATTFVVSVRLAQATPGAAWLWPADGLRPTSVEPIDPAWFDRIDAFTAPRVESLTCEELVETIHWATPPGCASYEVVRPEVRVGEDATAALTAEGGRPDLEPEALVLEGDDLAAWLALRGLGLDPDQALALQPHLDAGRPVLAVRLPALAAGDWSPPIRFEVDGPPAPLPLAIGAAAATTRHELLVYTLTPASAGNPGFANFPRGYVEDDCLLPPRTSAQDWLEAGLDALPPGLPTWVLEHASLADRCAPCAAEPLLDFELRDLGGPGDPAEARVGRLRMRVSPGTLDQDPALTFDGSGDAMLRWLERDPRLGFAFPTCGEDGPPADPGTCPDLTLPGAGCATGPSAAPWLAALLVAVGLRRRGAAVALALALLASTPASAAPPDRTPRTELHGGAALVGTDRIVPAGLDRGAPGPLSPYLGLELRRSLFAWRDGRDLGLLIGLRGLAGDAAPGPATHPYGFLLAEPAVGIDLRHGRFREASPCFRGRYGLSLAVPVLDPGPIPPRAVPGAAVHAGAGWWFGRGTTRASIELRGIVLPRTDGYETTFHPNVGLPGFLFFPGTANLWLIAGAAFR